MSFTVSVSIFRVLGGKHGSVFFERTSPHLTTTLIVIVEDNFSEVIDQDISDLVTQLDDYEVEKSGWCVYKIHHLDVAIINVAIISLLSTTGSSCLHSQSATTYGEEKCSGQYSKFKL